MCVCVFVCLNSCNASQQNNLVQMTLDLLFDVVAVAIEYNAAVLFASLNYNVVALLDFVV